MDQMYMTGWMIFFCALICIAVLLQASALFGMFMQVRRVSTGLDELRTQVADQLNSLSKEVQQQAHSLGEKANATADIVKAEVGRLENDIAQVRVSADEVLQTVHEIRQRTQEAFQQALYIVNAPSREANAVKKALQTGLRVLFSSTPRNAHYKRTA